MEEVELVLIYLLQEIQVNIVSILDGCTQQTACVNTLFLIVTEMETCCLHGVLTVLKQSLK